MKMSEEKIAAAKRSYSVKKADVKAQEPFEKRFAEKASVEVRAQEPSEKWLTYVAFGLLVLMAALMVFQVFQTNVLISEMKGMSVLQSTANKNQTNLSSTNLSVPGVPAADLIDVIPKGVPPIYVEEMSVSFDDISLVNPTKADETIARLADFDVSIELQGAELERYVKIVGQISCEYCCGAESIIFTKDSENYKAGDAACGCAHSYAMRGVAKYLISSHGADFTDDEILSELAKWKTLFFPSQMTNKAKALQLSGIEFNYINLGSNKYRGIEATVSGGDSGMVGGC